VWNICVFAEGFGEEISCDISNLLNKKKWLSYNVSSEYFSFSQSEHLSTTDLGVVDDLFLFSMGSGIISQVAGPSIAPPVFRQSLMQSLDYGLPDATSRDLFFWI
jgi:hypothetical protein